MTRDNTEISLSPVSPSDEKWLTTLLHDVEVRRQLPHLSTDASLFIADMLAAERTGLGLLRIIRWHGEDIGFIAVYDLTDNPFIFYAMLPAFRRHGYMHQAITQIQSIINRPLYTHVAPDNHASIALLSSAGIHFIH